MKKYENFLALCKGTNNSPTELSIRKHDFSTDGYRDDANGFGEYCSTYMLIAECPEGKLYLHDVIDEGMGDDFYNNSYSQFIFKASSADSFDLLLSRRPQITEKVKKDGNFKPSAEV